MFGRKKAKTAEILAEWLYRHAEVAAEDIIYVLGRPDTPAILRALAVKGNATVAPLLLRASLIVGQLTFQMAGQSTSDGELPAAIFEYLSDNGEQEVAEGMANMVALCNNAHQNNGLSIDQNLPILLEMTLGEDCEVLPVEERTNRVHLLRELLFKGMEEWWARPPGLARA